MGVRWDGTEKMLLSGKESFIHLRSALVVHIHQTVAGQLVDHSHHSVGLAESAVPNTRMGVDRPDMER
jgi:hypothetical protein